MMSRSALITFSSRSSKHTMNGSACTGWVGSRPLVPRGGLSAAGPGTHSQTGLSSNSSCVASQTS